MNEKKFNYEEKGALVVIYYNRKHIDLLSFSR